MAATVDLAEAGRLIAQVERGAEDAAVVGLRALAAAIPKDAAIPEGAPLSVAVAVKPAALLDDLAGVLRSHAWMHAAEGVLYRHAVLAAASACGWTAHAVDQSALPDAEQALVELGQAAGLPWRRQEKDAAGAALTLMAGGG
jgi:hypothetical protein